MRPSVNEILRIFGHAAPMAGQSRRERHVLIQWLENIWQTLDRKARESQRSRERAEERRLENIEERKKREERQEDLAVAVLLSDEMMRFEQQVANDLQNVIAVTRLAYERAEQDAREAEAALRQVQDRALVLADGRRVYFTADDQILRGENHTAITDDSTLSEARKLKQQFPGASSYEEFQRRSEALAVTQDQLRRLGGALEQLDELNRRINAGGLTEEELVAAQGEIQEIVASLPASARADYERLQAGPAEDDIAYREANGLYNGASRLPTDFAESADPSAPAAPAALEEPAPDTPGRAPVYKPAFPME